ncbi:phenylacetate--CoA ligase family protein [Reinekea marinisedimentorum]|uniref:Phenylacetate-CoA ligase n=1 Tax=Reinekea marinisedimentorum TaxID=230495 RepID=A0A4R3IEC8_9GAMM|nr:phenylacetate--CoA ligase family protein [Reinekea marinisedimentorum]TCS44117.1 phenylacetate-CoA ligase [Reinekea marinisedimentorum]
MSNFYKSLPYWLQNVLVTGYGYKQSRIRYHTRLPSDYFASQKELSSTESNECRNEALKSLLTYAVRHVPFYRKLYQGNKFSIDKIVASDLPNILPVINKKIVRDNLESFISDEYRKKDLLAHHTSGTTGSPGTYFCTKQERAVNFDQFRSILLKNGCDYRDKSATFAGRMVGGNKQHQIGNIDCYNKTLYLSSYGINSRTVAHYINWLNRYQPKYIDSYPSSLYSLVVLAKEAGVKLNFSPQFIVTSSETLSPEHRLVIADFFDTKLIDHYGSTEMVFNCWSDGSDYYHFDETYVPEFLNRTGDVAELVATPLFLKAMPLIRYTTGDKVVVSRDGHITEFIGRMDDVLITPSGNRIGRLDPIFKGLAGIREAQIEQVAKDSVVIRVVKGVGFNLAEELRLIENLSARLNNEMAVNVEYIESIKRTSNGKFKAVIGLKPS